MQIKTQFFEVINQGGVVMWVLVALSVLALGLALERWITLRRAARRNRTTRQGLATWLRAVARGEELSTPSPKKAQNGPLAAILKAGVHRAHHGPGEAERAMEAVAALELRRLQRGMAALASIANVAPLLGFLGTAAGMMVSFDALAELGLRDPGLVAIGIKTALTTTVGGLAVAIPVQLAYNYLLSTIAGIIGDMEHAATQLLGAIADRHGG
jgi:biopolymer transport protein ExbB